NPNFFFSRRTPLGLFIVSLFYFSNTSKPLGINFSSFTLFFQH
ncbi:unnamed protein product, partial [Arabidopsis halleri]